MRSIRSVKAIGLYSWMPRKLAQTALSVVSGIFFPWQYFQRFFPIPVTVLVENEYALGTANGFESFRTHWTIKNINLLQVLQDAGIKMWG